MKKILALDAAWTADEPSGVAVVAGDTSGWKCLAAVPSYEHFLAHAEGSDSDWTSDRIDGSLPDAVRLLAAARKTAGGTIDLVTIDMPVATVPLSSRRAADDAVSKEFGARSCAAHSPNSLRPGPLGALMSASLVSAGFPLATTSDSSGKIPRLVEVYPHPALLSLLGRPQRVPYKVSKTNRYWPEVDIRSRISLLLEEFTNIYNALSSCFGVLPFALPAPRTVDSLSSLKRYEDVLDALVCAWVGVEYLSGRTVALGDDAAAIWCPSDVVFRQGT